MSLIEIMLIWIGCFISYIVGWNRGFNSSYDEGYADGVADVYKEDDVGL